MAFQRLTDPLFGWIPDITVVPRSRQVAVGVIASIVLHALIFLLAIVAMLVFPQKVELPPVAAQPNLEVIVQNRPEQPETVPVQPKPERRFMTKEGLKPGEKPKNAKFESDKDMTEGSEVPPTGTSELPGQEGEKAPFMRDFVDQDISLNRTSLALRQAKMEPPKTPSEAQPATVAPLYAPLPLDDDARAKAEKAKPDEKLPEPAKPTQATPPPLPKVKSPSEMQIAMLETPKPAPMPEQKGEDAKTQPQTKREYNLATPAPLRAASPAQAFREQLRKTRSESMITNRGISGVNAVNTPAGRWTMMVTRSISQNWQTLINQSADLATPGTVRVKYSLTRAGGKPQVLSVEPDAHASTTTVQACTKAVSDTPFPPPPADLFEEGDGDKLEDEFIFHLY